MTRKHLLIGGSGLLGAALRRQLVRAEVDLTWTARDAGSVREGALRFDLAQDRVGLLPTADVTYLAAAVPSTIACERDPSATWRVNVDAPLAIARRQAQYGHVIFVSSDAVEFCGHMEYGRQKAQVEAAFALNPRCSIVRPGRFTLDTVDDLARFILSIEEAGLYWWPT